ncbi:MAG: hypothetical protein QF735_04155, partial [Phycisphaeraceae bacterium]|nr:hypothetical protein [Phycisphaeraceae bacterium]
AAANPYLAAAAYIAAGLDGIENKIDPGEPNLGNMYDKPLDEIRRSGVGILPQSLWEALEELRQDEVIKGALGPIADEFIDFKAKEWETYDQQITSWEVQRYLTFL